MHEDADSSKRKSANTADTSKRRRKRKKENADRKEVDRPRKRRKNDASHESPKSQDSIDSFDKWADVECKKAEEALLSEDNNLLAQCIRTISPAILSTPSTSSCPMFREKVRQRLINCVADLILFMEKSQETAIHLTPVLAAIEEMGEQSLLDLLTPNPLHTGWRGVKGRPRRPKEEVREPAGEEPIPVSEEPVTEEPVKEEPVTEEPVPVSEEPVPAVSQELVSVTPTETNDITLNESPGSTRKRNGRCYQKCVAVDCKNFGLQEVKDADKDGPAGWRCNLHGGRFICAAQDCLLTGTRFGLSPGSGKRKRFCSRHAHPCVFPGCVRAGIRKVDVTEGPSGYRCRVHGGTKTCDVADCSEPSTTHSSGDDFGPAGHRCVAHGRNCTAENCGRRGHRKVSADELGPEGYRCLAHGGAHPCAVPGCKKRGIYKKFPFGDKFGPAGFRCTSHMLVCVVQNCMSIGKSKAVVADQHGASGYRCYKHRAKD